MVSSRTYSTAWKSAIQPGDHGPRNAFAPAASLTIWKTSAIPARHHTFFEIWGIFLPAILSRITAIELAWISDQPRFACEGASAGQVYAEDDDAFNLWRTIASLPRARSSRIPPSDKSGPGRYRSLRALLGRSLRPWRQDSGAAGEGRLPRATVIEIWKSGVHAVRAGHKGKSASPWPRALIDTGRGWNVWPSCFQGKHDNYGYRSLPALYNGLADARNSPDG